MSLSLSRTGSGPRRQTSTLGGEGRHPLSGGKIENTGEPDAGLLMHHAVWVRARSAGKVDVLDRCSLYGCVQEAPGKWMSWIAAPIRRLESVLNQSSTELMQGAIVVVNDGRHRVRKLPIGS